DRNPHHRTLSRRSSPFWGRIRKQGNPLPASSSSRKSCGTSRNNFSDFRNELSAPSLTASIYEEAASTGLRIAA
ncbi:MAG: hypothetical protein ABL962_21320, partial [Fimbriimonadaceae bacterium]